MVLQGWADEGQKREYLPKTCESIMAFALTEPTAGSDLSSISARFEDKGDHFLLNGKNNPQQMGNGHNPGPENGNNGYSMSDFIRLNLLSSATSNMINRIGVKNHGIKA